MDIISSHLSNVFVKICIYPRYLSLHLIKKRQIKQSFFQLKDVAAATFMATATTMPEFFTNTISTFVTDSDLGIGAIIGSMLFNTLGTSACAALASTKVRRRILTLNGFFYLNKNLYFKAHSS